MINTNLPPLTSEAARSVSFSAALKFWLKLGFISFGGPAGQIAIMHQELVERRRWISEVRFLHALNYCMLLPGPEATQLAVYIGWLMHGTWGGVVAGALFVLPGACLLLFLSWIYVRFGNLGPIPGVLFGFKCAVVALVLGAILRIGKRSVRSFAAFCLACMAFFLMKFSLTGFPVIILLAALIGWIGFRFRPDLFGPAAPAHGVPPITPGSLSPKSGEPGQFPNFLIDDCTPTPDHARIYWPRLIRHAGICAVLLAAPLLALMYWRGYDDTFSVMGRFFTLAAFVTIGGAYAVLPYVTHMSTHVYHWLQRGQMMDGLALGETTPGPLILVLTFVGFVGAWNVEHTRMGMGGALLGGIIATYFTFLPSFMLILLGAPFVESTRGELKVGVVLSAITAAVVGVIANLALVFGQHVLYPNNHPDFVAAVLVFFSFAVLYWRKWNTVWVLLGCAGIGLLLDRFHVLQAGN